MIVNRHTCVASFLAFCGTSCGTSDGSELPEHVSHVEQADQCGSTWDLQDVEFYDGSNSSFDQAFVAQFQGAFGRHCSGTMISSDLFLSVVHSGCAVEVGDSVGFNCQVDGTLPYPTGPAAAAAARCQWYQATEVWKYPSTDRALDISVSRIAGSPGWVYGWVLPTRRLPDIGSELAIIQHGTHDGRRKMIGFGPLNSIAGKDMRFAIDVSGGASGAGILDAMGLLVGVTRADGCASGGNVGTTMQYVVDNVPEVRLPLVGVWAGTVL